MKLLFLDVDGVLNDVDWGPKNGLVPVPAPSIDDLVKWIDPERVKLVNEIVARTGALIILSSSTRSDPRMGVVLAKAGLKPRIWGVTSILLWEVSSDGSYVERTRAEEVQEELDRFDPESFVVLDDQNLGWERLGNPSNFLVKTEFATGLLREHVELAVRLLNFRV